MTPGATFSIGSNSRGVDRALAVDRVAERIDHAAFEQAGPIGTSSMRPVQRQVCPSARCLVLTEHHGTHRIALEVQRHAVDAALETRSSRRT
jgi:hypothetical protein